MTFESPRVRLLLHGCRGDEFARRGHTRGDRRRTRPADDDARPCSPAATRTLRARGRRRPRRGRCSRTEQTGPAPRRDWPRSRLVGLVCFNRRGTAASALDGWAPARSAAPASSAWADQTRRSAPRRALARASRRAPPPARRPAWSRLLPARGARAHQRSARSRARRSPVPAARVDMLVPRRRAELPGTPRSSSAPAAVWLPTSLRAHGAGTSPSRSNPVTGFARSRASSQTPPSTLTSPSPSHAALPRGARRSF